MLQSSAHKQKKPVPSTTACPSVIILKDTHADIFSDKSVSFFIYACVAMGNLVAATIGQEFCFQSWALSSTPLEHTFVATLISSGSFFF
jgi:hypothetical protein